MRLGFLLIVFCVVNLAFGQMSIGVIGEPNLNLVSVNNTPLAQSDSIKQLKRADYTLGLGIEIRNQIDRYNAFIFSPSFLQTNVLLVKENLQFLDVIHPQLPEIRDFGQTAEKKAFIRHRQFYAGLQIAYAKRLQLKLPDSKFFIETGGGLAGYALLLDDVKVRTEAFAIGNDFTQIISDSTGTDVSPYLVNLFAFGNLNYTLVPDVILVAGLRVGIPLTSTTTNEPRMTIFTPGLNVGFRYIL